MSGEIRVLLAEDVAILRAAIAVMLASCPGARLLAEAGDGAEAVRLAGELEPDVVLMDLSMPVLDGPEALARIKRASPGTAVLALTAHDDPALIVRTYGAGADGYLLKDITKAELCRALERAAAGQPCLGGSGAAALLGALDGGARPLSEPQRDLLEFMAQGMSEAEAGSLLGLGQAGTAELIGGVLRLLREPRD
ncbi:response regulator [Fundidesulfovibrio agrisoli]|uniref:response regulator n=1 Tax=Fundidesulfovibrio agrisoli TaxID=2922717 RepID=UPI001FACA77F|nr:response regulator transcription factor [Fundidesulfovibrio agrisoli]